MHIGSFGVTLQVRFSDIVVWTGRLGLYLAIIYFLIALLSSRKDNSEALRNFQVLNEEQCTFIFHDSIFLKDCNGEA